MKKLTPREYGIFAFIRQFIEDSLQAPTRKEIGEATNLTPQGADYHVQKLAEKDFIKLKDGKRNIRLTKKHYRRQQSIFDHSKIKE